MSHQLVFDKSRINLRRHWTYKSNFMDGNRNRWRETWRTSNPFSSTINRIKNRRNEPKKKNVFVTQFTLVLDVETRKGATRVTLTVHLHFVGDDKTCNNRNPLFHWSQQNTSYNERTGNKRRRRRSETTQRTAFQLERFVILVKISFVKKRHPLMLQWVKCFSFSSNEFKGRIQHIQQEFTHWSLLWHPTETIHHYYYFSKLLLPPAFRSARISKKDPNQQEINSQRQMINFVLFFCKKHNRIQETEDEELITTVCCPLFIS